MNQNTEKQLTEQPASPTDQTKGVALKALKAAFPKTLPILAGFGFLGMTYGVFATTQGLAFWYPMLMSVVVFGGSLEFVLVSMLLSPFAPLQTFIMALMIQARHLFYGIALLDKYKGTGKKKFYLIYGMCDESFSINCSVDAPDGIDSGWFMFFVNLLDQSYWVLASTLGALLGSIIDIQLKGLDFVMTAMFVVIFLNQLLKEKNHIASIIGIVASVACLLIFGSQSFLLPTMAVIVVFLLVLRKPIEGRRDTK